jgi:hypothetical protein
MSGNPNREIKPELFSLLSSETAHQHLHRLQKSAQEVSDRTMSREAKDYMWDLAAFKAGLGPDPGPYKGPVIDFEKAAEGLEQEDPEHHDE